jgi:hypothetical protein
VTCNTPEAQHSVTVQAETLYEAVAEAVVAFREAPFIAPEFCIGTPFEVEIVPEPIAKHKVRLGQIRDWVQPQARDNVPTRERKDRIRAMIGDDLDRPLGRSKK